MCIRDRLILVTLFATGAVGTSIARVKDLVDTVHIALSPAVGWPQQTGLGAVSYTHLKSPATLPPC